MIVKSPETSSERRPLASREFAVFKWMATRLVRAHVSPNAISIASMIFGVGAGATAAATAWTDGIPARALWLAAALLVQLRLLANMLDGMVAIEAQAASRSGELYNEAPDRVSDPATLVGLGFAAGGDPILGFLAALVAMFVAYVRALGASVGAGQVFLGPLAKPQRMFFVTLGCLYAGAAPLSWQPTLGEEDWGVAAGVLALITVGGLVTAVRRLMRIAVILRDTS